MADLQKNYDKLAKELIALVGGFGNIDSLTNCMTRLRISIKNYECVQSDKIKATQGVLGLVDAQDNVQIILGPGKAKRVTDICQAYMKEYQATSTTQKEDNLNNGNEHIEGLPEHEEWKNRKSEVTGKQPPEKFKALIRNIAEIFLPLIPAIIAAGLFAGLGNLILALQDAGTLPSYGIWKNIQLLFNVFGNGFLAYFAVFTGINAAKQFGATLILGGMIGGISICSNIVQLSESLGLYNTEVPLDSILNVGKGGVIGVILGVWILSKVEKWLRKHIPESLSLILVSFLSVLISGALFVLVIMPASGALSDGLIWVFNLFLNSDILMMKLISGYVLAALYLPLILLGLHQGLVPIYIIQLESLGGIYLFPVLTMAGAGQVGAATAIWIIAKAVKNENLIRNIKGALPAGVLGVAEPLIYGVTLPLGKPFFTAGLGAGFGGAFVMANNVMSVAWDPGGILGAIVMWPQCIVNYIIGLFIAAIGGFIVTFIFMRKPDVMEGKPSKEKVLKKRKKQKQI